MSNKIKHTPGPWHLKDKVVCANIKAGTVSIETPIADVCFTGAEAWKLEEQANAKLIAAAPELLAFVEEMVERYPNSPWIYEEALRLIKKATL